MREPNHNAVTNEDIEAIIHSQVEKAKQGDTDGAKFIVGGF